MTTIIGRTAIGLACMTNSCEILRELLTSCTSHVSQSVHEDGFAGSEAKKWRKNDTPPLDSGTPEGMEGLQWEDEITCTSQKCSEPKADGAAAEKDDEWSVLYQYYASVIEKTGEMLANTISTREPHCLDALRKAPIHYAAASGSYDCMELLLKHNAPVNMTTGSGHTALHMAVEYPRIVILLLQHKASPNKLTFFDQMAPIHFAAKIGNTETVRRIVALNNEQSTHSFRFSNMFRFNC